METIAEYRESKIKTYGLEILSGLSLVEFEIENQSLGKCKECFRQIGEMEIRFEMIFSQYGNQQSLKTGILIKQEIEKLLVEQLSSSMNSNAGKSFQIFSPVAMISFFGPHFGDRYGIASTAITPLIRENISILGLCCSGSIVYLVINENKTLQAEALLKEVFQGPSKQIIRLRGVS